MNATQPAVLQRGLKGFYITDWSRDGSSILIRQFPVDVGPQRSLLVDARTGQLKELPFQGRGAIPVLPSQMRYAQARLSPDGKFLADTFIESSGSRKTGVVVTGVDVDKPYKIAGAPADAYVFGWSPDGGQLLYVSDQSRSYDLWTVAVKEGRPIGVPSILKKDFGLAQAKRRCR